MLSLLNALLNDEAGFVVSAELALVSTIGVLGMVAGLTEAANSVNHEMHDVANAYRHLDQSYSYQLSNGMGSSFQDNGSDTPELGG